MTSTRRGRSSESGLMHTLPHCRGRPGSKPGRVVYPRHLARCGEYGVRDEDWRPLADEALQRLLIERWLYRGLMLCVVFVAAVIVTWVGSRGFSGPGDRITVGMLLALAIAAA